MKRVTVREEVKTWTDEQVNAEVVQAKNTEDKVKVNWSTMKKRVVEACVMEQMDRADS